MMSEPWWERSAGISVFASQPPPTKRYRSSCGRTLRSKPSRSRPDLGGGGAGTTGAAAAGGASGAWEAHAARTAAAAITNNRRAMKYPRRRLDGREYKKSPKPLGLGAARRTFDEGKEVR